MANPHEIEQWLQQGIIAAKTGQLEQARFQLLDVVEQDQTNETAWYWLYKVFDRVDDKRTCLENLILINSQNMWAKRELLDLLEKTASRPQPPVAPSPKRRSVSKKRASKKHSTSPANLGIKFDAQPVILKLVTAFWFGISFILLGGGLFSALEWLLSPRSPVSNVTFQLLDLTLGVFFIIAGILTACIAVALLFQSMLGFYGSILLALGLLVVGPTFSLIVEPPNYIAMSCTGGVAGLIVLLTLASQAGLKDTS